MKFRTVFCIASAILVMQFRLHAVPYETLNTEFQPAHVASNGPHRPSADRGEP